MSNSMQLAKERLAALKSKRSIIGWIAFIGALIWHFIADIHTATWLYESLHIPQNWRLIVPHGSTIIFLAGIAWLTFIVLRPQGHPFNGDVELFHVAYMKPVGGTLSKPIFEGYIFLRLIVTKISGQKTSIRTFLLGVTPKSEKTSAQIFEAQRQIPTGMTFEKWTPRSENPGDVSVTDVQYGVMENLMETATGIVLPKGAHKHGWLLFILPKWNWDFNQCSYHLAVVDARGNKHEIKIDNPEWVSGGARLPNDHP